MELTKPKLRFDISGYYFIGLLILAIVGFGPSYFIKFFDGTANFTFYFHFHATMMVLWVCMLILQPILIQKKQLTLHKLLGKLSYFLFPMMFISIILLTHSQHKTYENLNLALFIPFKDLIILATAYTIALWYKKDINIHARAMIATGIVFIEPALVRLISYTITASIFAFYFTLIFVYALLIGLIIRERNQKNGRWVFPLILAMYLIVHSVILFEINPWGWDLLVKWFISLPLT